MSSNTIINQNIELTSVLCSGNAVAFNGILSALKAKYPTTGWTSALLTTRLTLGKKQGMIIAVGSVPGGAVQGYALNKNMLRLNFPHNALYAPFCSQVIPIGCEGCGDSGTGTGGSSGTST